MKHSIFLTFLTFLASLSIATAAPPTFKEGQITLSIKVNQRITTLRYQKKGNILRIDQPGRHIPAKPINFIDLKTGNLRILRPHNATWMEIPGDQLTFKKASPFPEPPTPTGIGARPTPPGTPGKLPPKQNQQNNAHTQPNSPRPTAQQLHEGIDPQPNNDSPAFPGKSVVPALPKIPEIPKPMLPDGSQLPPGIGPGSGNTSPSPATSQIPGLPGLPGLPGGIPGIPGGASSGAPPSMPGMGKQAMTLTTHKETRSIHGYPCIRHTLTIPREGVITLWLTEAADLPPFHTLMYETPLQRGRMEWQHKWTALLREKQLFPLLAVLRDNSTLENNPTDQDDQENKTSPAPRKEIMRWEITSITAKTIEDKEGRLFKIPAEFHKMQ